jgi:hypothetical protein
LCVGNIETLKEDNMKEQGQGENTTASETKPRRKRRSSNYFLEQLVEQEVLQRAAGEKETDPIPRLWSEVGDGFLSPKQALAHVSDNKLQGVFRVVRVTTPLLEATMTPQEPVWTMKKVKLSEPVEA